MVNVCMYIAIVNHRIMNPPAPSAAFVSSASNQIPNAYNNSFTPIFTMLQSESSNEDASNIITITKPTI